MSGGECRSVAKLASPKCLQIIIKPRLTVKMQLAQVRRYARALQNVNWPIIGHASFKNVPANVVTR